MPRIVHIALKVDNLEEATKFYTEVFGFKEGKTGRTRGHTSRRMSDGHIDFTLMTYDDNNSEEAQLAGDGPRIHHWGISMDDKEAAAEKIEAHGGTILSERGDIAVKFRAPDGTIAEVVAPGLFGEK
jgi:lactoylglutathione lyase